MQEGTLPVMVQKTSKAPFYSSVSLLIGVLLTTVYLMSSNISLANQAEKLNEAILAKKTEITELSKDKNVIVTRILQTNTIPPSINLRGLIANFRDVAARANVRLKGFDVTRDTISTNLSATEGNPNIHPDPASTIVTMMRAYMTENGDGKFILEPIRAISGDGKMRSTAITLKVTPTSKK